MTLLHWYGRRMLQLAAQVPREAGDAPWWQKMSGGVKLVTPEPHILLIHDSTHSIVSISAAVAP